MKTAKIQRTRYIQNMLAEEANHGLNMQMTLAELPEKELDLIEQFMNRCRKARSISYLPQELQVTETEAEFAYS